MLTIGCHESTEGGFLKMAKEAVSIKANTFQYFTRNPRGGAQKPLDQKDVDAFATYHTQHGIHDVVAYAPYSANPATSDAKTRDFALMVYQQDMERLENFPGQQYLIRCGEGLGIPKSEALNNVADALNQTLSKGQKTPVLLDTMAGEGTQVGSTFQELAQILDRVTLSDQVGVCLDAAAVWAAGYDLVHDLDGVLEDFDQTLGLDKLRVVHLNDSTHDLGSNVDRHARIGEGEIGFDTLAAMINHPRLQGRTFILEEPSATLVIYEHDIAKFQAAYTGK